MTPTAYPPGLRGVAKFAIMELVVRAPVPGAGIATGLMAALRRARPEPCWTLSSTPTPATAPSSPRRAVGRGQAPASNE